MTLVAVETVPKRKKKAPKSEDGRLIALIERFMSSETTIAKVIDDRDEYANSYSLLSALQQRIRVGHYSVKAIARNGEVYLKKKI